MSMDSEIAVTCPSCQCASQTTVWSSINASVDPHLKRALFAHEVNILTCACGKVTEIATELLYHDMERKYNVWLRPPDADGTITLDSLTLELAKGVFSDYRLRIVRSRNQLLEKIRIFDSGYDDRAVELLKYGFWRQLIGDDEPTADRMFFSERADDGAEFEQVLTVVVFDDADQPTPYEIPTSAYADAATLLSGRLGTELVDDRKWRIVGREFARAFWSP